ncbi:MAG TPA: glycosyltransferase [Acidocella sp.]|nr:glycosyltransferase [Acidocella sp.]
MKFLFVHQNFPGQYLHIVRNLLADNEANPGTHEIVFMTEPNLNVLAGVRKVTYAKPPLLQAGVHRDAAEFDVAMRRAEACATGARQIKKLGFVPDIIIGHHGWGEMLNLGDVFPGVPLLGYFEFYYQPEDADVNFDPEFPMARERFAGVRAKNAVNLQALALEQHGQVPTRWQKSTYPEWAKPSIHLLEEGVDLDVCKPIAARAKKSLSVRGLNVTAQNKLITYVARNLEPYRGFHTFMRALPKILAARPDAVVSVVGGDEISYGAPPPKGNWREVMLAELGSKIDLTRVHFLGKIPYDQHLALLKRSDAHIYLSYPFVASWSLREALACGCLVIGADTATVTEFVKHRKNGLVVPTLDHDAIAETTLMALASPKLTAPLRLGAREFAEKHLDLQVYLARYRALIEKVAGKRLLPVKPKLAAARPVKAKPTRTA